MSDVILAALIGAAASIVVNLITLIGQNNKRKTEEAVKDANLENRLNSIEEKLDQHNGYADKITKIATDVTVIKTKVEMMEKTG